MATSSSFDYSCTSSRTVATSYSTPTAFFSPEYVIMMISVVVIKLCFPLIFRVRTRTILTISFINLIKLDDTLLTRPSYLYDYICYTMSHLIRYDVYGSYLMLLNFNLRRFWNVLYFSEHTLTNFAICRLFPLYPCKFYFFQRYRSTSQYLLEELLPSPLTVLAIYIEFMSCKFYRSPSLLI